MQVFIHVFVLESILGSFLSRIYRSIEVLQLRTETHSNLERVCHICANKKSASQREMRACDVVLPKRSPFEAREVLSASAVVPYSHGMCCVALVISHCSEIVVGTHPVKLRKYPTCH